MLYEAAKSAIHALKPSKDYHPFPTYRDRTAWGALPDEIKAYYKGLAEGLVQCDLLAPLPAARYMDFLRNGNRSHYEAIYFARRANLMSLVVAECIAGDGALVDDIVNLVWAICEESSWCLPAHNGGTDALPNPDAQTVIDLFAAETGSALSWTYYLLGDVLGEQSPIILRRIEIEVKKRILDPYMEFDGFWWMSIDENVNVNNWNPWVNSSSLHTFLLIESNEDRRKAAILRSAKSVDRFIGTYFPDGGCDEGPSYFGVAGGALFDYLEALHGATDGTISIYHEPLIQNMAKYIYRVHISGDYFVNFADAPARTHVSAGLLLRVGDAIQDETLCRFARYMLANNFAGVPYAAKQVCIFRALNNIFAFERIAPTDAPCAEPQDHFFEGIQVATARQCANSNNGFFLACKGGHNAESHNHNDVGSFVLYNNGHPIVIDAGVETYSRKTFSDQRYEIWTMCSDYHNLPDINGTTQLPGKTHCAQDVRYTADGTVTEMTLDIAQAYSEDACVSQYERSIRFDRALKAITVSDRYKLTASHAPIVVRFICAAEPLHKGDHFIIDDVQLNYNPEKFNFEIEPLPLSDPKIASDWQRDTLYRILLTETHASVQGAFTFIFAPLT